MLPAQAGLVTERCRLCAKVLLAKSIPDHERIPHFRCASCEENVFVGWRAWHAHASKYNHAGEAIQLPPRPAGPQTSQRPGPSTRPRCRYGCSDFLSPKSIARHERLPHSRCRSCGEAVSQRGTAAHRRHTGHGDFVEIPPSMTVARPCVDGRVTPEVHRSVQALLQEMTASGASEHFDQTRWHVNTNHLARLIPDPERIPYAVDGEDVVRMSEQGFLEEGPLDRPVVIQSAGPELAVPNVEALFDHLTLHFGDTHVDVQDMAEPAGSTARKKPLSEVKRRFAQGADLHDPGCLPVNLLNLRSTLQSSGAPSVMGNPRFGVLSCLSDEGRSSSFALFAQRGAYTLPHVDVFGGTRLTIRFGVKLWIIPARFSDEDRDEFEAQGPSWVPRHGVRVLVLFPGDTLVMPARRALPHAPLTLEDCYMTGSVFLDAKCIPDTLEELLWVARHPIITNESVPLQLIECWPLLRRLCAEKGRDDEARFDDLTRQLKEVLSCRCQSACSNRSCPCRGSLATDFRCTAWCHPGRKTPGRCQLGPC